MFKKITLATSLCLMTSPAWALVDAYGLFGMRSGTITGSPTGSLSDEDLKYSGTDITVAAHLSPWLPPIAIGASYNMGNYAVEVQGLNPANPMEFGTVDLKGSHINAEVMVWIPLKAPLDPFLTFGVPLSGTYKAEFTATGLGDFVVNYKHTGYDVTLGARYSPVPKLDLILAYKTLISGELKFDSVTLNGATYTSAGTIDPDKYSASTILLGVGVGI